MQGRTVVFVGRRAGASAAAKALGMRVLAVLDGEAAEPAPRRWTRPFADRLSIEALAPVFTEIALRRSAPVAAVVALTERAVVPAAWLRAALQLPGQDVDSALRCTDKLTMKRAVAAAGIACADHVSAEAGLSRAALIERLGLPLVVKMRASSGSRGTRVVHTADAVPPSLEPGWMAEAFVAGVEMSVESFVAGGEVVFENPTEYFRPAWANIVPATLAAEAWALVRSVNRRAIAALGVIDGITHCEVFRTPGGVVFGELAARPPGGHLMELLRRAYDFDPWETLLRIAIGAPPRVPQTAARRTGVWLFHPGPGTIAEVTGVEEARSMAGVVDLPFRGLVGDDVTTRVGVGQELGHVTVEGGSRDEVAERLTAAHGAVRIAIRKRTAD